MKKLALSIATCYLVSMSCFADTTSANQIEQDEFPHGTSWPDLPKETSFPAAIGTIPDFSYRVHGKDKSYPTTGIGVTVATGGSTMYAGGIAVLVNYNLTQTDSKNLKNAVAIVTRIGLGNRWDIAVATPQLYTYNENGAVPGPPFGSVGSLGITLHKQHMAKQFGESALSVATNYIINAPISKTASEYGIGWGAGATWQYRQMAAQFDITATIYTDSKNPAFASKGGYYYAFNNFLYAGVEYNWDYTTYKNKVYTGTGSNSLAIGPTISAKIPKLKNSAFGMGIFYDLINQYEGINQKMQPWKFSTRLAIFY